MSLLLILLIIITILLFFKSKREPFYSGLQQLYASDTPFTYINPKKRYLYTEYPKNVFNTYFFYYPFGYYPNYYTLN